MSGAPVSNPGLPMTAALFYTSTMVLYTGMDPVECVVDGAPPGPNGRLFIVNPGKPTKVPYEAGRFILDHLGYTGVVRVDEHETRDADDNLIGIEYDVEKAKEESLLKGEEADQRIWAQYISDCMDDFVARKDGKSKAPPPPPERIQRIIKRRGFKLSDYGIKPVGFKDPVDERNREIAEENADLKQALADMRAQIRLMGQQIAGNAPATQPTTQAQEPSNTNDDAAKTDKPLTKAEQKAAKARADRG